MRSTPYRKILMIGNDPLLLDSASDSVARMEAYAELYEEVNIVNVVRGGDAESRQVASNVWVHPVPYRWKIAAIIPLLYRAIVVTRNGTWTGIFAQDPFVFGLVAWFVSRLRAIPVGVGIYGTDITNRYFLNESIKNHIFAMLAMPALRLVDIIQTDSPETVESFRFRYGNKVFFKPMLPANRKELEAIVRIAPSGIFKVLFVGRFVPQKNLQLLIDVIEALKKHMPGNVHVTLVGAGPLKEWFMSELKQRGCDDMYEDRGSVARERISELYATHHVLLLTSWYEGFPRVFMEAAMTGMPVVTTRVGGLKDLIIDGESGRVFPQGASGDEIATAIQRVASDNVLYEKFSVSIKTRWDQTYGNKTVLDYQRTLADAMISHRII